MEGIDFGEPNGGHIEWCEDSYNVHLRHGKDCIGRRDGDRGIDVRMIQLLLCVE